MSEGTPKTMKEAISNAVVELTTKSKIMSPTDMEFIIHKHVKELLSQKITILVLDGEREPCEVGQWLWSSLFPELPKIGK